MLPTHQRVSAFLNLKICSRHKFPQLLRFGTCSFETGWCKPLLCLNICVWTSLKSTSFLRNIWEEEKRKECFNLFTLKEHKMAFLVNFFSCNNLLKITKLSKSHNCYFITQTKISKHAYNIYKSWKE